MKKHICKTLLGLLVCIGFYACNDEKYDTKAIAQEVRQRQVKRLTDTKLLRWVELKGTEVVIQAQKNLLRALYALQTKDSTLSLKKAYQQIDLQKLPNIDSLQRKCECQIRIQSQALQTKTVEFAENKTKICFQQKFILDNEEVGFWIILFDKKKTILGIKPKDIANL
ncbi:MAG: hypothetical protein NZ551_03950 [Microscillaceae bacterium]|nr:hypothetical protein [Microscillaceae bacterium]MDW8460343.1 hypothetical protein [Cytophagales bacterium]